jgi:hypothetical protein
MTLVIWAMASALCSIPFIASIALLTVSPILFRLLPHIHDSTMRGLGGGCRLGHAAGKLLHGGGGFLEVGRLMLGAL